MSYVTIAERYYTKIGMKKGMKAGRAEGQASLLMRQIERRFGPVPDDIAKKVSSANTDQLETWSLNFVDADVLEDVFRD